tara:strand:+ start:484 stop:963 length:480 start_codon:yes stop_codon:yes gene_type:complete
MEISQSLWVAIAFVLFFVLVGRTGYKFLVDNLDERKKSIEEELIHAKRLREQAQAELNSSLKKQKEISLEIEKILNEAKAASLKIKSEYEKKSELLIKRREKQANDKINAAQIEAINQIREIGTKVAILSSELYIKENIDKKTKEANFDNSTIEISKKL